MDFGDGVGSEQKGIRPAIVVQNDKGNQFSPTTIVCPLTTKTKKLMPTHVGISASECDVKEDSIVLCEQTRVIDKARLKRQLGKIENQKLLNDINSKIAISFGL